MSALVVQLPQQWVLTMVTEEPEAKKQIKEECIINSLPGDLIERIFFRLPVSTLLTCRGVCKQWQNFIRDPQFAASHLQLAPSYALLFFPQGLVSGVLYPSDAILIDKAWSPSTYAVPVIGPDDFLFGSCNGLLGSYTKTSTIKIANLATGECLHLEKPSKNVKGDHYCFYSFGFHPVTKEYKITHFLGDCVDGRPHNKDRFNIIQVYTLGDEKWKDIRTPEPLSLISVRNSGVVNVDGKMYWLTEDMLVSWQHAVISFDLREESFATIQLPAEREDQDRYGPRKFWIREMHGKICIVTAQPSRYDPRALLGELQIWTLENTVQQQRWSKKYNIKNPPNYIPGPHSVHRDRIMTQLYNSVCSYELFSENFEIDLSKKLKLFDSKPRWMYNMQSYIVVKSLVSLDVYKKAGIVRRPKQQVGWELKKWKSWEDKRREAEDIRCRVHKHEHALFGNAEKMGKMYQSLQDKPHDVAERLRAELNQVLQDMPDSPSQPKSPRRLNWVEQKQDYEKLMARSAKLKERAQAHDNILSIIASFKSDKVNFCGFKLLNYPCFLQQPASLLLVSFLATCPICHNNEAN
ncbi:unnamed protein product [Triticum turgidum subsp. durum]|uniref:F-box domain-containing protein n=1 Tax=Triticum turgidum subsp. durum TaxID=4567 RepID=A0A9R0TTS5_TRITD|nr:unnamed protein product [Triticum turgidum subsp. durum]